MGTGLARRTGQLAVAGRVPTHLQDQDVVELLFRVVAVGELADDRELLLAGLLHPQVVGPEHHVHQGERSRGSGCSSQAPASHPPPSRAACGSGHSSFSDTAPDQGRAPPDPGQGPPAHAQVLQAVGRGQHESGVDQGAPAEVGAYHLQRRHVGPRVRLGFPAAHDLGRLHRAWGQWRQRPSLPPAPGGPLWASPVLQMGKLRQSPSAPPRSLPPLRAFSPRMSCPGPTSVSPSAPGGRWAGVVGGHPPEPAACGQTDGRTHGPLTSQQRGQQG